MISCTFLQEMIAALLMGLGLIFLVGSMIGMLRLPDFYSRVHASGNSETLGTMLVFLGLAVYNGVSITSAKLLIILMFIFLGNPIGSHILTKAAYKTGHPVWTKKRLPEEIMSDGDIKGGEANADIHS
ncbi:MAG: monovalent cation/H(+) antiporter subunit G [Selenomonadaceae bacterium]|nr:monovalent cation/H(+) antiporter subunit G [Selenomonadaceae bacterium]